MMRRKENNRKENKYESLDDDDASSMADGSVFTSGPSANAAFDRAQEGLGGSANSSGQNFQASESSWSTNMSDPQRELSARGLGSAAPPIDDNMDHMAADSSRALSGYDVGYQQFDASPQAQLGADMNVVGLAGDHQTSMYDNPPLTADDFSPSDFEGMSVPSADAYEPRMAGVNREAKAEAPMFQNKEEEIRFDMPDDDEDDYEDEEPGCFQRWWESSSPRVKLTAMGACLLFFVAIVLIGLGISLANGGGDDDGSPMDGPTMSPSLRNRGDGVPTAAPTRGQRTRRPTDAPRTDSPSSLMTPTVAPVSRFPTDSPTMRMSPAPSEGTETFSPSLFPTEVSTLPSPGTGTFSPSLIPTAVSSSPTTDTDTLSPSLTPSEDVSTNAPSGAGSSAPSELQITATPSSSPTNEVTMTPTSGPSSSPSATATEMPTADPTSSPSRTITAAPTTSSPTFVPTESPVSSPTAAPSEPEATSSPTILCEDLDGTFNVGPDVRDCEWLAANRAFQTILCSPTRALYSICRATCNSC